MIVDISTMFQTAYSAVNTWFLRIVSAIPGVMGLVLGGFLVYQVVRFLLKPIVGSAGSDRVRKTKGGKKDG